MGNSVQPKPLHKKKPVLNHITRQGKAQQREGGNATDWSTRLMAQRCGGQRADGTAGVGRARPQTSQTSVYLTWAKESPTLAGHEIGQNLFGVGRI